jgi:hypothetical protein
MIIYATVIVTFILALAGYLALLGRIVRNDGHSGPILRIQPPRSHPQDMFDPALRF